MPVLRNRQTKLQLPSKDAASTTKTINIVNQKQQAKVTSGNGQSRKNLEKSASQMDSLQPIIIQTRAKQKHIIDMFQKKSSKPHQKVDTNAVATATSITSNQIQMNSTKAISLDQTLNTKKRKRAEFEKENTSVNNVEAHAAAKQLTKKRLISKDKPKKEDDDLIELPKEVVVQHKSRGRAQVQPQPQLQQINAIQVAVQEITKETENCKQDDAALQTLEPKKGRNRNKTADPPKNKTKAKQQEQVQPVQSMVPLIPGLYEKALPFSDPELQLHRRLQASDPYNHQRSMSAEHLHIPHSLLSQNAVVIYASAEMRQMSLFPDKTHLMLVQQRQGEQSVTDITIIQNFIKENPDFEMLHRFHVIKHKLVCQKFMEEQYSATMSHLMKINSSHKK